ncbi:MAG: HNH endonuclease [Candidatus Solibacter usitatus]|nr:HNH endonuclease [Candidatus Solibacter usitatus]
MLLRNHRGAAQRILNPLRRWVSKHTRLARVGRTPALPWLPRALSRHTVRTSRIEIPVPSVIRLCRYRRVPRQNRSASRKGVLLRDGNTCQYCRRKLAAQELTLDHVVPRSRSGSATWENLVACCLACNNRKGNRTPQEAGMVLMKTPRPFSIHAKLAGGADEQAWEKYLFC